MNNLLSVIVTGRNDAHQGDFLDRLTQSTGLNCKLLETFLGYDFEYVIVDWCSGKPLSLTEVGNVNQKVIFIEVSEENIKGRFLHDRFYQFFAKNLGIRHCHGNWVLLVNADNVLSESLILRIKAAMKQDKFEFYRTRWWNNSDGKKLDCTVCDEEETGLAPVYSGDFLLSSKKVLVEAGKGYDESNPRHQTMLPQAQMDGEILFNMKLNGAIPVIWEDEIYHINHPRGGIYDKEYNRTGYLNSENWGLKDLEMEEIKRGIFKLSSKSNECQVERIPRNFFMAWGGSTPPVWCKKAFDEYKDVLGPHWNCKLFNNLDVPEGYRLYDEQKKLPFFTYKSDIFRIWLLETYGGIWVDTDTRIIKPFDDLLIHEGIVTVHRDSPNSPMDEFHTDSCMIGSMPNGRMLDFVVDRAKEIIAKEGLHQFSWNFYHTLMGNCPQDIFCGAFDEITTAEERKGFIEGKFDKLIPKRKNSYIRHYLTNLYGNK